MGVIPVFFVKGNRTTKQKHMLGHIPAFAPWHSLLDLKAYSMGLFGIIKIQYAVATIYITVRAWFMAHVKLLLGNI